MGKNGLASVAFVNVGFVAYILIGAGGYLVKNVCNVRGSFLNASLAVRLKNLVDILIVSNDFKLILLNPKYCKALMNKNHK